MRKHDVNNINLEINKIDVNDNGIFIQWSSDIGFGGYSIYKDKEEKWKAASECMDCNNDKDFGKKLLELFINQVEITG